MNSVSGERQVLSPEVLSEVLILEVLSLVLSEGNIEDFHACQMWKEV